MNIDEIIRTSKKKIITKEELYKMLSVKSDEDLYPFIQELTCSHKLEPVIASRTNGNRIYPIYMKYRVRLPQDDFLSEKTEIAALHPVLQANEYLYAHPAEYKEYRDLILKLDRYLFRSHNDKTPISRKERSFEIFDEEKALDNHTFCQFLLRLGLDQKNLYFYDTPEYCFHDYIPEKKQEMVLLICENKDIWFNIRRRMYEDHCSSLFDCSIDGVVYGCGNQVSKTGALTSYTTFLGGKSIRYLYWGDIDRAGLNIFLSLRKGNPEMNVQLFIPAYEEMLKLAENRSIPDSEDKREQIGDYSAIYSLFTEELQHKIKQTISDNKRLPQEIIPYTYLKKHMR